jgi:xanthine/CO dehydrogenase XdhC/CoxF family maturation factor
LGEASAVALFATTKSPRSIVNVRFVAADITCCHSPIGLSIEAETPEEIAVSIGPS